MPLPSLIEVDRRSRREFIRPHAQASLVVGAGRVASGRSKEDVPRDRIGLFEVPAQLERLDVHICKTPCLGSHVQRRQREFGVQDRESDRKRIVST